ncbi:bestrophin-4 isoform X3 [Pectinophora gossypiella]|uniref:bestrophin-4 isoform X3 n=1 Tax=Pectinophora gossypiella TaxID=13191 RepID=UPI00214EC7B3|nr:bestrophin-4 isoform X3 [Pectinophora gossypiella]
MTISYAGEVPNGSSFGCFWRILCKWRGSVYKLVWRELLAYLTLYYTINLLYRFALTEPQQRIFEKVRQYFGAQSESIPMSFVLGFYVSLIVKRWWEQYKLLPWPDTLALFISAGIPGAVSKDETGRLMRRNIVRYAILAYVITLQRVSLRVKRRFPTWQHVVDSGLMLESERKVFEKMDGKSPMSKYWMPLVWATNIINRARKEGLITSDHIVQTLLVELSDIRRRLGALIGYDTVCVPLVYTQVVTLALYTYFVAALMGRQLVPPAPGSTSKYEPDVYFPLFTALQFCFYVGWLKVAEVLINPFGEDDDDIELNWLIDRHIKAAYMIVDEMHEEHPELLKDQYWEEVVPKDLPYTVASEHYRRHEPACSADHYKVKAEDAVYANVQAPRKSHDETYADYRQISRMGSVRSASTAYSSGGLFGRNRHNSVVYSSPEAGQPTAPPPPHHKMSLYERLVGRKSGRGQHRQNSRHGGQKSNGSAIPITLRNRPRIPTPDVTKEVMDRENRLAMGMQNMGVIMAQGYQNEVPVLGALVLSPIQELDSGSVNNTLHAGQPGTTALAQAVLSPGGLAPMLTSGPVTLSPMGVSQLTLVSSAPSTPRTDRAPPSSPGSTAPTSTPPAPRATVTELPSSDRESDHSASTGTPPQFARKPNGSKRGEVYV